MTITILTFPNAAKCKTQLGKEDIDLRAGTIDPLNNTVRIL